LSAHIAQIWRHPIKGHGREEIAEAALSVGRGIPFDRRWAVAHERSCFDISSPRWQPSSEFSRGAKSPRLQAIDAQTDEHLGKITLTHPDCVPLTIDPDNARDANMFIQWVMPISNGSRMMPARLVRGNQAMTDTDFPSISLINLASHRALETHMERELSPLRWRGNLLIEGWEPWSEKAMVGLHIQVGAAILEIREEITRCTATTVNVATGERDADTLGALRDLGHQEMGLYAIVVKDGEARQTDAVITVQK